MERFDPTKQAQCPKCWQTRIKVMHLPAQAEQADGWFTPYRPERPERLKFFCQCCGYTWEMLPADAEEE